MYYGTICTIKEVWYVKNIEGKSIIYRTIGWSLLLDPYWKWNHENYKIKALILNVKQNTSNLYMLLGMSMQEGYTSFASNSYGKESTIIWNHNLGHMSKWALKIFIDCELLPGLKLVTLSFMSIVS